MLATRARFVFAQFSEHILRVNIISVVISDSLQLGDVPNGAHRGAADFAHSLRNGIGDRENLVCLLVQ